jgi:hypothetical protein
MATGYVAVGTSDMKHMLFHRMRVRFSFDFFSVILGTTTGQVIAMDHHGNTIDMLTLSRQSIRQLMYSCSKFYADAPDTSKSFIEQYHYT